MMTERKSGYLARERGMLFLAGRGVRCVGGQGDLL